MNSGLAKFELVSHLNSGIQFGFEVKSVMNDYRDLKLESNLRNQSLCIWM